MKLNELQNGLTTVASWRSLLDSETKEVDRAGVKAAVIVVHLAAQLNLSESTGQAGHPIVTRVLKQWLRPTDRAVQTDPEHLSILITPTAELAETVFRVNQLDAAFASSGFDATCSFAQRRPEENLVASWGRAQGELDRVLFCDDLGGCLAL